jgi:hypothetical protein
MCRVRVAILAAGWSTVVAAGAWVAMSYELTPAAQSNPTRRWPDATGFVLDPSRPTLVLFLHPKCPCSRATLAELERLLSPRMNQVAVRIALVRPAGMEEGWERTDLWTKAERIHGAKIVCDPCGVESRRFGARTSGEVMLFTPDGRLVYDGGITGLRGHEGDNPGRAAVASLIDAGGSEFRQAPVFGCGLSDQCSMADSIQ